METTAPIVAAEPKKTCPVAKFGCPHVFITGAFYWPLGATESNLYEGYDYSMCGACGQIECDS